MTFQEIFLISILFYSSSALHIPSDTARSVGLLLPRADPVCGGNTGLSQCGGDFPSEFCCQTGSTCFGFNNDQSVICCPKKECGFINMLSCNPSVYNATAFPDSPIHMADLSTGAYTPCTGSNLCCPKGYLCSNGGCKLDTAKQVTSSTIDPGAAPTTSRGSSPTTISSLSSTPNQSSTSISIPSATAAAASSNNPSPPSSGPQYPWPAILIGLVPGLVVGCILAFLFICCLGRRKARKLSSDSSSSLGPTIAKISDPIYHVDPPATRTDFLRHASRRIVKKASRPFLGNKPSNLIHSPSTNSSTSRVRSIFRKTPTSTPPIPGRNNNVGLWDDDSPSSQQTLHHQIPMPDPALAAERALDARMGRMNTTSTRTDPRTPRRELSMESIPIYNNTPDACGFQRNTAFADLLPALTMHNTSDPVPTRPSPPEAQRSPGLMPPIYFGSPLEMKRRVDGGVSW